MNHTTNYFDWIKSLPNDDLQYAKSVCPKCSSIGLSFQYFSLENSEFGWKIIWCKECDSGIQISRTKIPHEIKPLTDEDKQKEFLNKHSHIQFIS